MMEDSEKKGYLSRALKEEEEFYLQRDAVQMLWRKYKQSIPGNKSTKQF